MPYTNAIIWIFIALIAFILIRYVIVILASARLLMADQAELCRSLEDAQAQWNSPYLREVTESYKQILARSNGTPVNFQTILDLKRDKRWHLNQSRLNLYTVTVVSLGLLGTFFGLLVTLNGFNDVLSAGFVVSQLDHLTNALVGLDIKFISSIAGLIAAILMNGIAYLYYRPLTEHFHSQLSYHLENVLAPAYTRNDAYLLGDMLDRVESSLGEKIDGFSRSVTTLSASMTTSSQAMSATMTSMSDTVALLNNAVNNLLLPLNDFSGNITRINDVTTTLGTHINTIQRITDTLVQQVTEQMSKSLQNATNNIETATQTMREGMSAATSELSNSVAISVANLQYVMGEIKTELNAYSQANQVLVSSLGSLKEVNTETLLLLRPIQEFESKIKETMSALQSSVHSFFSTAITEQRKTSDELNTDVRDLLQNVNDGISDRTRESAMQALEIASRTNGVQLVQSLQPSLDAMRETMGQLTQSMGAYQASLDGIVGNLNTSGASFRETLSESYGDYKGTLASYSEQLNAMKDTLNRLETIVERHGMQETDP